MTTLQEQLDQVISQIIKSLTPFELIIFDFDCTISKVHTCTPDESAKVDADQLPLTYFIDDSQLFQEFIKFLIKIGKKVAVVSFGNKDVISIILNRIFPDNNPFTQDNIIDPSDISPYWLLCQQPPENYNKNNMLEILAERNKINLPNKILFLDDTNTNINNANSAGYSTVTLPPCKGILTLITTILRKFTNLNESQIQLFAFSLSIGRINMTYVSLKLQDAVNSDESNSIMIGDKEIPLVTFEEFSQRINTISNYNIDLIAQQLLKNPSINKILTVIDQNRSIYLVAVRIDPATGQIFPPV